MDTVRRSSMLFSSLLLVELGSSEASENFLRFDALPPLRLSSIRRFLALLEVSGVPEYEKFH